LVKLIIYTPPEAEERILRALANVGVGTSGNYECWAIGFDVTEQFRPTSKAQPFEGSVGALSRQTNRRLEFHVPQSKYLEYIEVVREVHPYETPAIEVIPLLYPTL